MAKIQVLDIDTVNKIAAGEVVERPASVVKELVENSIDAGATAITIEMKNGGITFLRVTDNGCGIAADDVETAFLPHSTSKLRSISDLSTLYTMGFRGEALASIASVSKVDLLTKTKQELAGTAISLESGKIVSKSEAGCPEGTTVVVRNLFYNTPARMNFLKKDVTEAAHITEIVDKMALGHPEISFRLIHNGRETLFTTGTGVLEEAFSSIYGREMASSCKKVIYEYEGVKVNGLAGLPTIARANRGMQNFFVNGRWVRSKTMMYGCEDAYRTMLMTGKFPVLLIGITLNAGLMDVNVHPTKMEVKFADEKLIHDALFWGVQNALFSAEKAKEVQTPISKPKQAGPKEEPKAVKQLENKNKPQENKPQEQKILAQKPQKPSESGWKTQEPKEMFTREYMELFRKPRQEEKPVNRKKERPAETQETILESQEPAQYEVASYRIVGQVFQTYIIIETNKKMMLIDQHAAHERMKYEELVEQKTVLSQMLMLPETIQLSVQEADTVLQNLEIFRSFGFEIEEFGNHKLIVRQVPSSLEVDMIQDTVLELAQLIKTNQDPKAIYDKGLFMVACKSAVKANHNLSPAEMDAVVKQVLENDKIRTCPHGRPVMIAFDQKFIEKEFKRIV